MTLRGTKTVWRPGIHKQSLCFMDETLGVQESIYSVFALNPGLQTVFVPAELA